MKIRFTDNTDHLVASAFEDWVALIKDNNGDTQSRDMNEIFDKPRDEIIQFLKLHHPEDFV